MTASVNEVSAMLPKCNGQPVTFNLANGKPSLGSIAESSSTLENCQTDPIAKHRYKLLRTARKLLPEERIAHCQHTPAPDTRFITVDVDDGDGRAKFNNLIRCDSPQCPFCSAARSEGDRHELSIALAEAKRLNYFPLLLTFTLSHHANDQLDDLRAALRKAFDKTFSGRWYQDFKERWHVVGKITGNEVTYGRNGWHPHLHILMFCELEYSGHWPARMQAEISARWQAKIDTLGYSANLAHGVDVRTAESDIADYVAKWGHEPIDRHWGADTELAKSNVKRAAIGGLTPFQILGVVAGVQTDTDAAMLLLGTTDVKALKRRCSALFCEFWYAYKGRARLHWGQMWKLLDLDVALENYELNNHEEPLEKWPIAVIDRQGWKRVRGSANLPDLRAELLTVCQTRDAWKVRSWLVKNGITGGVPFEAFRRSLQLIEKQESEVQ